MGAVSTMADSTAEELVMSWEKRRFSDPRRDVSLHTGAHCSTKVCAPLRGTSLLPHRPAPDFTSLPNSLDQAGGRRFSSRTVALPPKKKHTRPNTPSTMSAKNTDKIAPTKGKTTTKTVVRVADKKRDPTNARRVHYRVEAEASVPDEPERPTVYAHMDMEAELRATTLELDSAICDIADAGLSSIRLADGADAVDAAVWDAAETIIATCSNLNDKVVYARRVRSDENVSIDGTLTIDTRFENEFAKLTAAYKSHTIQHYASTTPLAQSKDLKFMRLKGYDAATFYDEMSAKYQRPATTRSTIANVRGASVAATAARRRQLDACDDAPDGADCEGQTGISVFNCDSVSSDSNKPGCKTFTEPSIPLYDEVIEFGGTDFGIQLSCEECAITIGSASVYSKTGSESDDSGLSLEASSTFSMGAEVDGERWVISLRVPRRPRHFRRSLVVASHRCALCP
jgi:hypothetical protein